MAYQFYVTIEGTKQGKFKSEVKNPGKDKTNQDKIVGLAFDFEIKSPRDMQTGQASGKRQYQPLRFWKKVGPASPMLFQALVTNEVLKTVDIEFMHAKPDGTEAKYYTIKLTNATICGIHQEKELPTEEHTGELERSELEEIAMTFHRIEVKHEEAKTVGSDEWSAHNYS